MRSGNRTRFSSFLPPFLRIFKVRQQQHFKNSSKKVKKIEKKQRNRWLINLFIQNTQNRISSLRLTEATSEWWFRVHGTNPRKGLSATCANFVFNIFAIVDDFWSTFSFAPLQKIIKYGKKLKKKYLGWSCAQPITRFHGTSNNPKP